MLFRSGGGKGGNDGTKREEREAMMSITMEALVLLVTDSGYVLFVSCCSGLVSMCYD